MDQTTLNLLTVFLSLLTMIVMVSMVLEKGSTNIRKVIEKQNIRKIERKGSILDQISLYRDRLINCSTTPENELFGSFDLSEMYIPLDLRIIDETNQKIVKPEEIIKEKKLIVILGDPGTGKTTLLQHLQYEIALGRFQGISDIPVFIPLVKYVNSEFDLCNSIIGTIKERQNILLKKEDVVNFLKKGYFILLLDGLDEIGHDTDANDRFIHNLEVFTSSFPKVLIVITCRTPYWNDLLPEFTKTYIEPLNEEKIRKFIINRFSKSSSSIAENLNYLITNNDSLRDIAKVPLFLMLITHLYNTNIKIVSNKFQLFSNFVDLLLRKWDDERKIHRDSLLQRNFEISLLGEVALNLAENGITKIRGDDLFKIVSDEFPEKTFGKSRDIVKKIEETSGILKKISNEDYCFNHISLQEYFSANKLSCSNSIPKKYYSKILDPSWRNIFLFVCSSGNGKAIIDEIHQRNVTKKNNRTYLNDLFYLAECIKESPTTDNDQMELILLNLKTSYHSIKNIQQKIKLANLIADIDKNYSSIFSKELLQSKILDDQIIGSIVLSKNGNEEDGILNNLIRALTSNSIELRKESTLRLGYYRREDILELLLAFLTKEKNCDVKSEILRAINHIISNQNHLENTLILLTIQTLKEYQLKTDDDSNYIASEVLTQLFEKIQK